MAEGAAGTKPRLLVLTSTYPRWRADPEPGFVHELSRRLADSFDVTVLGPHAPGASVREDMDGVRVVRFRYAPERFETLVNDGGIVTNLRRHRWKFLLLPLFLLSQWLTARRLARDLRPHVIHAHWLLPQGLTAAIVAGHRIPFVVTSHGADLFALRDPLSRWLKRFVARRAAALTVVSASMLDRLDEQGLGSDRACVMPMGVDLQHVFRSVHPERRMPHRMLFVGRLVEKKGLRYLLDAMPRLLQGVPEAELLVAGFGPERPDLEKHAATLGIQRHVHFLGPVPQEQLPELYSSAKVFVAPFVEARGGDQEGLGLVAVEAAACGAVLVLGDVPATTEFEGLAPGIVRVDPRDGAKLAEVLTGVLKAGVDQDAQEQRRKKMLARFDWSVVTASYAGMLRALVASPGKAD